MRTQFGQRRVDLRTALARANAMRERAVGTGPDAYMDHFVSADAFVPSRGRLGRYAAAPLTIKDRHTGPTLRDYQAEFVEAAWARYLLGQDRMLCVMPTGAGKTPTVSELMQALVVQWHGQAAAWEALGAVPRPLRDDVAPWWPRNLQRLGRRGRDLTPPVGVLAVAHRDYLIETLAQGLRRTFGNEMVGILRGSTQHLRRPFIVASAQTLADQMGAVDPMRFGLVVVDEAHHYVAGNRWADFLIRLGFLSPTGEIQGVWPRCLIGMTATPERLSGPPLHSVFGPEGLVAPIDATSLWARPEPVIHKPDFIRLVVDGDINAASGESLAEIVDDFMGARWASADDIPHSIIFVSRVAQIEAVVAALQRRGVEAAGLSQRTPASERDEILAQFRQRRIRVLVNVSIVGEGLHIPSVELVMLFYRSDSRSRVMQNIGRLMSIDPFHPEQQAVVVDAGGNIERHRLQLTMAASYEATRTRPLHRAAGSRNGTTRPAPNQSATLEETVEVALVGRTPRTTRVEDAMRRLGITAEQLQQLAYRSHWLSDQLFAYFNGARVPETLGEMQAVANALGDTTGQLLDAWAWEMVAQHDVAAPLPATLSPARRIWHRYVRWVLWRRYGGEPLAIPEIPPTQLRRIIAGESLLGRDGGTWATSVARLASTLVVPGRAHWLARALNGALADAACPPWWDALREDSPEELMRVGLYWYAEHIGHVPMPADLTRASGLPTSAAYARRFGSWAFALRAIGIGTTAPGDLARHLQLVRRAEAAASLAAALALGESADIDVEVLGDVWAWRQVALQEREASRPDAEIPAAQRSWGRLLRFLWLRCGKRALCDGRLRPITLTRLFSGAEILGSDSSLVGQRGLFSHSWAHRIKALLNPRLTEPYREPIMLLLNEALRAAGYPPWSPDLRDESHAQLLLRGLAWLADVLGRAPTRAEVDRAPGLARAKAYDVYFGSWPDVLRCLDAYRAGQWREAESTPAQAQPPPAVVPTPANVPTPHATEPVPAVVTIEVPSPPTALPPSEAVAPMVTSRIRSPAHPPPAPVALVPTPTPRRRFWRQLGTLFRRVGRWFASNWRSPDKR